MERNPRAGAGAQTLPTGVVTYCLTDLEDSTAKWYEAPDAMGAAVARHQELIARAATDHRGVPILAQGEGDSTLSAFDRPGDALAAAAAMHAALAAEPWTAVAIKIRIGIHTGEAEIRDGTYYGVALNHTGRVRSLGRGGQTIVSRITAELARTAVPEGMALHDAGIYDLKGLPDPEQVYALAPAADTDAAHLAVPPNAAVAGRITAPPTSFVGRGDNVAAVVASLARHRLVTVSGPGGAGKTRLSLEVARAVQTAGTPVVLVDLAPVADARLVPQTIATAAGMSGAGELDADQVAAQLTGRRALIVLDNCEHLVAPVGALLGRALAIGDAALFLVTSQASLGIAGEHVYPLGSLRADDAVSLFHDRALGHDPGFDVNSDATVIADICIRLDGLPLAIELAAAHVRLLTPEQILERLDADVLGLRAAPARDMADRQRTLRAAIDWSVGLLTDDERTLLGRLAVFQGGFTLSAAEAVCSDDHMPSAAVFDVLAGLVDRSLVARRRRGRESRFWLLETIRAYAWDHLDQTPSLSTAEVAAVVLRREGEVWALVEAGRTTRFRDSKGLRYVADLLRRPGVEFHAMELAGRRAEAGIEVIDQAARRAYRQRLGDLESERDDAEFCIDDERRVRAELEIDALTTELARSVGLDGRTRRTGSAAERARVSVTKAIRQALARIAAASNDVGAHLDRSITTGTYCRYDPVGPAVTVEIEDKKN